MNYEFAKGYYSRVTDRLHGRVTRLFMTPLLQAMKAVLGPIPLLEYLGSFPSAPRKGWIRALKGHAEEVAGAKYKEGDRARFALHAQTTDKILAFATNGRFYTIGADKLPGGRGFGDPVRLLIDLPNDQAAARFVKGVIDAAADRFDDDRVTVDRTVFNPARIWKLYGTIARKGDEVPKLGLVHRRAQILEPRFEDDLIG